MAAFVSGLRLDVRRREMEGRADEIDQATMRKIDWLAVAIGNLGGPGPAARALGVSRQTVYTWLETGLGTVQFAKIVAISEKGDVPLEYLRRRVGKWQPPPRNDAN